MYQQILLKLPFTHSYTIQEDEYDDHAIVGGLTFKTTTLLDPLPALALSKQQQQTECQHMMKEDIDSTPSTMSTDKEHKEEREECHIQLMEAIRVRFDWLQELENERTEAMRLKKATRVADVESASVIEYLARQMDEDPELFGLVPAEDDDFQEDEQEGAWLPMIFVSGVQWVRKQRKLQAQMNAKRMLQAVAVNEVVTEPTEAANDDDTTETVQDMNVHEEEEEEPEALTLPSSNWLQERIEQARHQSSTLSTQAQRELMAVLDGDVDGMLHALADGVEDLKLDWIQPTPCESAVQVDQAMATHKEEEPSRKTIKASALPQKPMVEQTIDMTIRVCFWSAMEDAKTMVYECQDLGSRGAQVAYDIAQWMQEARDQWLEAVANGEHWHRRFYQLEQALKSYEHTVDCIDPLSQLLQLAPACGRTVVDSLTFSLMQLRLCIMSTEHRYGVGNCASAAHCNGQCRVMMKDRVPLLLG